MNWTKTKKILLLLSVVIILSVGIYFKLSGNQAAVQNEIKEEQSLGWYNAQAAIVRDTIFIDSLVYRGSVEAGQTTTVTAETEGKIIYSAIEKGIQVSKGSLLAKLDPVTKAATHKINQDVYEKAVKDYNNLKALLSTGNASEIEVSNAKLQMQNAASQLSISEKQIAQTVVTAPARGVIFEKKVNNGEFVAPGTPLCSIASLDEVKVTVYLPETVIAGVKINDDVKIKVDAYPDVPFSGEVNAIIPVASDARTFPIEVIVKNNRPFKLLAGMSISVVFNADRTIKGTAIPRTAMITNKKGNFVYVIHKSDKAVLTAITIGKSYGDYVMVTDGIQRGDTIMINGMLNAADGKQIQHVDIHQ
ncbi:efflux RND transporter periplasmic adaptor subunit [Chitinophaga sp.]|uniref:efflux RND transporter periplasmic adaptor subunit n=1 Tax=Chitinophaga sp. TaxID=1869181 RepID=UPI0031DDD78E